MSNFTHVWPLGFVSLAFTAHDQYDPARPGHLDILQQAGQGLRSVSRVHQHLEVLAQVDELGPAWHHLRSLNACHNSLQRQVLTHWQVAMRHNLHKVFQDTTF